MCSSDLWRMIDGDGGGAFHAVIQIGAGLAMRQRTWKRWSVAVVFAAWLPTGPAFAHHGTFMFDSSRDIQVQGTIRSFQWTNPHAWVLLMTTDARGNVQQTAFEADAPAVLARQGLKPNSFQPGDRVKVVAHPRVDGTPGGMIVKITLAGAAAR